MNRTTIRHVLSVFTVVVLVSAFATSPGLAQSQTRQLTSNIYKADSDAKLAKPWTPSGAAKKHSQRSKSISDPGRIKGLSLADEQ